ncbi:MAG: hypothetical protein EOP01_02310 [Propionibacteriaceae bacterium]|nr:MAG: hypothetical protein EOP01_02310 [Propionibacteriaceae bacterium]
MKKAVDELVLAASAGVRVVRSSAHQAPFVIDADAWTVARLVDVALMPSAFHPEWLALQAVVAPGQDERDVVRLGVRHFYYLISFSDSAGGGVWWQEPATVIERATEAELALLPLRVPASLSGASRGADLATALVLRDAVGVWAVRSLSATVYFVDADVPALLRQTGPGSSPGPGDDRWVPLLRVRAAFAGDSGTVRPGDRHEWTYDHDPASSQYGWWLQRVVTAIEPLDEEQVAQLPPRLSRGTW